MHAAELSPIIASAHLLAEELRSGESPLTHPAHTSGTLHVRLCHSR